jgi:hypothetical protein
METKDLDLYDLMLEGKLEEATDTCLRLYVDALEEGDRFIGTHIVTQLHFCIAGMEGGRAPLDVSVAVRKAILGELQRRGLDIDTMLVLDDIAIARELILTGKTEAEKSIERVDQGKVSRLSR